MTVSRTIRDRWTTRENSGRGSQPVPHQFQGASHLIEAPTPPPRADFLGSCESPSQYRRSKRLFLVENHRGSFEILIFLWSNSPASTSAICKAVCPNHETVGKTLAALVEMGLAIASASRSFPFSNNYYLSDYGRRLIEMPLHRWPALFETV